MLFITIAASHNGEEANLHKRIITTEIFLTLQSRLSTKQQDDIGHDNNLQNKAISSF